MSKELTTTTTTAVSAPAVSIPQMEKLNPKRGVKLTSPALQSAYNQMCEAFDTASKEVNAAGNVALTARERLNLRYEEILCALPFTPKGKLDPERMGGVKSVSEFAKAIDIPASTAYALLAHGRLMRSDAPDSIKAFPRSNYDAVKAVPLNDLVNAVNAGEISAETSQEDLKKWKAAYDTRMGKPKPAKVVTPVMLIRLRQEPIYDQTGEADYFDRSDISGLDATMDNAEAVLREHWLDVAKAPDHKVYDKDKDKVIKYKTFICTYARAAEHNIMYSLYIAVPVKPEPKPEPLSAVEHRAAELRKTLAAAGMADEAVKAAVEAAFPTVDYNKLK